MRHPEGPRFERRLKARQEARKQAEEQENQPPPEPDRRKMAMTPQEVEAWLKHNGISGGDRRRR